MWLQAKGGEACPMLPKGRRQRLMLLKNMMNMWVVEEFDVVVVMVVVVVGVEFPPFISTACRLARRFPPLFSFIPL